MSLLGTAALAMWWDVPAQALQEFEDWHSHEHFTERLGIPGFQRGSRWRSADRDGGVFVLYELADHGVLSSPQYLQRLNAPTPWSTKMMPHHVGMVRGQCRVLESRGGGTAGHALTLRFSPLPGRDEDLRHSIRKLIERLVFRPGLTGAHLLRHEGPSIAQTTEQRIRGGDREADWVFVLTGYDAAAIIDARSDAVSVEALQTAGAAPTPVVDRYTLAYAATPGDVR